MAQTDAETPAPGIDQRFRVVDRVGEGAGSPGPLLRKIRRAVRQQLLCPVLAGTTRTSQPCALRRRHDVPLHAEVVLRDLQRRFARRPARYRTRRILLGQSNAFSASHADEIDPSIDRIDSPGRRELRRQRVTGCHDAAHHAARSQQPSQRARVDVGMGQCCWRTR